MPGGFELGGDLVEDDPASQAEPGMNITAYAILRQTQLDRRIVMANHTAAASLATGIHAGTIDTVMEEQAKRLIADADPSIGQEAGYGRGVYPHRPSIDGSIGQVPIIHTKISRSHEMSDVGFNARRRGHVAGSSNCAPCC